MFNKRLLIISLAVLFIILECTFLNYIQILQIKPDILLIFIFFISLYFGKNYGLMVGIFSGFLKEATTNIPSGLMLITYSMAGLFLGHLARWTYPLLSLSEQLFVNKRVRYTYTLVGEACICFIFTFVIYFITFLLFQAFRLQLPLGTTLISVILPASIYTAFISPFLLRLLKIIFIK